MKLLAVISLLFIFTACSSEKMVEDKACDCYREKVEGFDSILEDLEAFYISEGVLESAEGASYKKRISSVLADPIHSDFPVLTSAIDEKLKLLSSFNPIYDCQSINSDDWEGSKWDKLIIRTLESANSENGVVMEDLYKAADDILSADDLNHPFYKAYFFTALIIGNGVSVELGGS